MPPKKRKSAAAAKAPPKPPTKKQKITGISGSVDSSAPLGVVDPASGIENGSIVQFDDHPCDVMLVLVDPAKNTDKYFVLQVIEVEQEEQKQKGKGKKKRKKTASSFVVYTRFGRTGTAGQATQETVDELDDALNLFEEKFKSKTGYKWEDRDKPTKGGKYHFVHQDFASKSGGFSDAKWEYWVDDGVDGKDKGWYPYDDAGSKNVEQLFAEYSKNKILSERLVSSGHFNYLVSLKKMTQTNVAHADRKSRRIRRVVQGGKPKKEEDPEEGEEEDDEQKQTTGIELDGKTVVFVGTLSQVKRAEAAEMAEAAGASISTNITAKTDLVVAGTGGGAKLTAAKSKGIEIISEEDFLAACEEEQVSLDGANIVFAGTLGITRAEATKMAKKAGVTVATNVSAKTKYVVAGDNGGSKLGAAVKKGIQTISEDQFMAACGEEKEEEVATIDGLTIVFVGNLSISRASARTKAEDAGATVVTNVGAKVDLVVAGPGGGSKLESAKTKGIKIIDENKFLAACGEEQEEEEEEEEEKPAPAAAAAAKPAAAKSSTAAAKSPTKKKGRRVDTTVPGREAYSVHEDWTVTLNQTNIAGNNNKYYIIQVLKKNNGFYAWNRWGRVGEDGQNKLEPWGTNENGATGSFRKKFRDKTKNDWDDRSNFVPYGGKYTIVETDDQDDGDGDDAQPIGKLSQSQIEKGMAVLADIQRAIKSKKSQGSLVGLSSTFFTLIPTNFGRTVPKPITTAEMASEKEELLKFYLRMGFDAVEEEDPGLTPISGVMDLDVPKTLAAATTGCCGKYDVDSSVGKGDALAKMKAGSPVKPMNKELYGSILLYTSNAIYAELNRVLRNENRSAVKKYFNYLRMLLEATDRLPKNKVTLWRGISVDLFNQYEVGKVITWWSVSSCTADKNVAQGFMQGCGGDCTLLTIETKTACDISQITFYSNEKESLLLPGTQLKVKSRKKNGKVAEIHMEEVGRALT